MPDHDMRFTVVDIQGTVSFIGDGFLMLPLVAACATNPNTLGEMLARVDQIDRRLKERVLAGLAVFDEHNVDDNNEAIQHALAATDERTEPVFRVVESVTRERSLRPTRTGLIIFNLKDHRIIQVLNHFYAVEPEGEVHLHNGNRYSRRTVRYALPDTWSIVP